MRRQRGAALVTAVLLAALIAVLVAGMLWQQWGSVERQIQDRQADQAAWIVRGAIDWSRLILQQNARNANVDTLSQPWATPLAETDLAVFLGARGTEAAALRQVWVAGRIRDAQSRFNLASVAPGGRPDAAAVAVLLRLCALRGVSADTATQLVGLIERAAAGDAPPPRRLDDLLRLEPQLAPALQRLSAELTLLPQPTRVNANTADATLLAAELGLDPGAAATLVQQRDQLGGWRNLGDLDLLLGGATHADSGQLDVGSSYFDVLVRVRSGELTLARQALVQRLGLRTRLLQLRAIPPDTVDLAAVPAP